MSQFTVYQNPSTALRKAYPYILDVQHSIIDELSTRIVIPLGRLSDFKNDQIKILSPVFEHDGEKLVLLTSQITSMPARLLKKPVSSKSILPTKSSIHLATQDSTLKMLMVISAMLSSLLRKMKRAIGGKAKTHVLVQSQPWHT